jgi:hypothetical protein
VFGKIAMNEVWNVFINCKIVYTKFPANHCVCRYIDVHVGLIGARTDVHIHRKEAQSQLPYIYNIARIIEK